MPATTPAYLDSSLPFETRAKDLLARLTLDEKCSQLTYAAPAIERLGIPSYNWWNECLHGVGRAGLATVFPQAIGLASTFNVPLMAEIATAISDEARAKHHAHAAMGDRGIYKGLTFWSPNINIFRDPRWGRGHETYGECPHLTSRMGVAFVKGLQGNDAKYLKLVATPKHFAVHSGPEHGRHSFDARISDQDLHQTYLPAFKATVQEGAAYSVMGAYNRLNGSPCCANDFLLNQTLRDQWGFTGYTVSDCGAITDLHAYHKVTPTPAHSAAMAVNNGLDLCCGEDFKHLQEAVKQGLIDEPAIDRACLRLLMARFRLGMFDPPEQVLYTRIDYGVVDSPRHRELALTAARQSVVLLKNTGILPLKKSLKRVAVIGPNAFPGAVLLGNYHGTPPFISTPLDAIRAALAPDAQVSYTAGTTHLPSEGPWLGTKDRGFAEAVIAAQRAELAIVCLGLTPTIEGEEGDAMNSDAGGDRTAIELPAIQQQLLEAVVATGTPVVLVIIAGSAVAVPWAHENVAAVVQQFYPGQNGGQALAEVLFGDHNPSGRLAVTVYRATADLPAFDDYNMDRRTYRFFPGEVLYPFGFGLSYTTFAYSAIRVSEGGLHVSATVTNTGTRAGDEVAQLYVRHHNATVRAPRCQLSGFTHLHLAPGQSRTVEFTLTPDQLQLLDAHGKPVPPTWTIEYLVSGSQPDTRSRALGASPFVSSTLAVRI